MSLLAESRQRRPSSAKHDNTESISGPISSEHSSQKSPMKESGRLKRDFHKSHASDTLEPIDANRLVSPYPDEYNMHDETGALKYATKGDKEPKMFSTTTSGEQRKQPDSRVQDQHSKPQFGDPNPPVGNTTYT